ncbi:MAG: hypothetical protein IJ555_14635 [Ruminococcus sp.]|nr:hypothetical protein [Ruminococcus sp.]
MNTEVLINCIGNIDNELIDFYLEYRKPKLSKAKITAAAVAASLTLTAGAVTVINLNGSNMKPAVDSEASEQSAALTESSSASAESVVSSAAESAASSIAERNGKVIISKALQEAMDNAKSKDEVFEIRIVRGLGDASYHNYSLTPDEDGVIRATAEEISSFTTEEGSTVKLMLADEDSKPRDKTSDNIGPDVYSGIKSITDELKKELRTAGDDELIRVSIELKDYIDLNSIEEQAMKNAGVTKEELDSKEAHGCELDDNENITYQQKIGELYNKISIEKTKLLNEYYSKLNNGFMEAAGLTEYKYFSISDLTPFINGIELPKNAVLRIAQNDEVNFLWYDGYYEVSDF